MDLKQKVTEALHRRFEPEVIELDEEGGISGFVVSPSFRGKTALDRQTEIHEALHGPSGPLTAAEGRRILAIAALTPAEYAATGKGVKRRRGA